MNNINTDDITNEDTTSTQVQSSGGDFLMKLIGIHTAEAASINNDYKMLEDKVNFILDKKIYPSIEKRVRSNEARIKYIGSLASKIENYKNDTRYKSNNKFYFLINVILDSLNKKIESYKSISNTASNTTSINSTTANIGAAGSSSNSSNISNSTANPKNST